MRSSKLSQPVKPVTKKSATPSPEVKEFIETRLKSAGHQRQLNAQQLNSSIRPTCRDHLRQAIRRAYLRGVKKGSTLKFQLPETIQTHRFTHTGFYINENGDFFIHDYGRNRRWQLPNSITRLKLIKDENSEIKLIPCDEHGNENPKGMPGIPDAYRFIDPVFAHRYQTKGYSESFVNIGLINFDQYAPGTLFSIEYDPKDPAIQRDAEGNILRTDDNISYFTKVKVKHNGQDIGMLSNDFHQFQGKIFLFVNYNYNYSYSDLLASVSPQVVIDKQPDGGQRISFERGNGDLAGTDRGYTDYKSIYTPSSTQRLTTNIAAVTDETPAGISTQPDRAQKNFSFVDLKSLAQSRN